MNTVDINTQQMDDIASDYLTGMYESQYDDTSLNGHTCEPDNHGECIWCGEFTGKDYMIPPSQGGKSV